MHHTHRPRLTRPRFASACRGKNPQHRPWKASLVPRKRKRFQELTVGETTSLKHHVYNAALHQISSRIARSPHPQIQEVSGSTSHTSIGPPLVKHLLCPESLEVDP